MKLVTAAEMGALEAEAAAAGTPASVLMENAGRAVANGVREYLGGARARRIVVLVGPGNNGGDGLVAARHLYDFGADVFVYLLAQRPPDDPNFEAVHSRDIEVVAAGEPGATPRLDEALGRADAVIDAVLGTGRARPLAGDIAATLDRLVERRAPLLAVDLPTGVDCDSGDVDPHAVVTDVTFALGFSKVGLHTLPGSRYAGTVQVLDIGLPAAAGGALPIELMTPDWARSRLPDRPASSNKGTFGRVLIVAGSAGYTGAAALAALGALRAGAGLVTLAAIAEVRAAVAALVPEVTYIVLPGEDGHVSSGAADLIGRELGRYDAWLIGCGLGQSEGAAAVVRGLLTLPHAGAIPAVIDADALNILAHWPAWPREIEVQAVLTPHPGELSRLTGESISDLQNERLAAAQRNAAAWKQTLVLKGAHTVIAGAGGSSLLSPFATAALATAGTGDVLAGAITGLIAQGVGIMDAAGLGVYLHGGAAESFRDEYGESGLLAGELPASLARAAARLRRHEG